MIDFKDARRRYNDQRSRCKLKPYTNGVPVEMRLTFAQWLRIWICSGYWDDRGTKKGQYCMARHNDTGHYEESNISIITNTENISFAMLGKKMKQSSKDKISKANKGKPAAFKGKTHTPETIKRMREIKLGKKHTPESIKHMSEIRIGVKRGPYKKIECPHCNKQVSGANLKRWHGDNCKEKPS